MENRVLKKSRIFLIDDHPAVRQGLNLVLSQAAHVVCGEAGSGAEAFAGLGSSGADMVLLDLSLGEARGLDLIARLRAAGVSVLVYSMYEDPDIIQQAFAAGAAGYVTKRENSEVLLAAVSDLQAGRRHVSPRAAQSLASRTITSSERDRERLLSEREKAILDRLPLLESNAVIADDLAISVRTLESYFSRMLNKLGLDGMRALRRYAATRKRS